MCLFCETCSSALNDAWFFGHVNKLADMSIWHGHMSGGHVDIFPYFYPCINSICRKAARQLNVLRRLSSLLDQESRMAIFRAFIVSNFNYCPLVWHFCGKTNTSKMEKLQERALRFVFNDFTSSYDNMLEKAELTTLTLSRIKTLALEVYKAIHGHSPPYMNDMFTSRQEQTHSLRNAHQLNIPCTRTVGFGSHSIQFEGARLWNHLPNKIRCAENLASFKKLLRTWGGCHCAICTSYF